MTFDDARCAHLRDLDNLYLELRAVTADPAWTDPRNGVYRAALKRFRDTLERIRRVNQAAADACAPIPADPPPPETDEWETDSTE